jgi:hypothetical protein
MIPKRNPQNRHFSMYPHEQTRSNHFYNRDYIFYYQDVQHKSTLSCFTFLFIHEYFLFAVEFWNIWKKQIKSIAKNFYNFP